MFIVRILQNTNTFEQAKGTFLICGKADSVCLVTLVFTVLTPEFFTRLPQVDERSYFDLIIFVTVKNHEKPSG